MKLAPVRSSVALLALASLALPVAAFAMREDPPAVEETAEARKERKIRRLMTAMDHRKVMEESTKVAVEAFAKMGLPESFSQQFLDDFDYDRMIDETVDVYAEHLEEETVDALIAFYESDQGKVFVAALPDISTQAIRAGQKYGEELALEIAQGK